MGGWGACGAALNLTCQGPRSYVAGGRGLTPWSIRFWASLPCRRPCHRSAGCTCQTYRRSDSAPIKTLAWSYGLVGVTTSLMNVLPQTPPSKRGIYKKTHNYYEEEPTSTAGTVPADPSGRRRRRRPARERISKRHGRQATRHEESRETRKEVGKDWK